MEPRVLRESPPPADERVAYGEHASQFVDYRYPAGEPAKPLVVMIHGGFWRARYDLLHAGHLCAALTGAGFPTANIEYRRIGEAGGGWPGTFEDVKRAVDFVRRGSTIVVGHSAGGHLALWVAAEIVELRAAIGLAPVVTLEQSLSNGAARELMGGERAEFPERYAYGDPARPARVPRVIIHGVEDEIVPVEMSRAYGVAATLIEVPGAGHFDVIDPESGAFGVLVGELGR